MIAADYYDGPVPPPDDTAQFIPAPFVRRTAATIPVGRVTCLWAGYVPQHALSLWPGAEGIGKSSVAALVAAHLTRGTLPGELRGTTARVAVVAPEDDLSTVWVPRLNAAGADLDLVDFIEGVPAGDGTTRPVRFPTDADALMSYLADLGVAWVWVDSLVATFPDGASTDRYGDVNRVLQGLNKAAAAHRITVCAGWHVRKGKGEASDVIMGSRGLATASRAVLLFARDNETGEGVIALHKANGLTRDVPAMRYTIASHGYDVVDADTGEVHRASCAVVQNLRPGEGRGADELARIINPPTDPDQNLSDRSREIAEYVDASHVPVAPKDVAEQFGIDNKLAGNYLARLATAGRIQKHSRGRYTRRNDESDECVESPGQGVTDFTTPPTVSPHPEASDEMPNPLTSAFTASLAFATTTPAGPSTGPCTTCGTPTHRYGEGGNPRCPACRDKGGEAA